MMTMIPVSHIPGVALAPVRARDPSITGCLLLQERMSSLATAVMHATFTLHAFHQAHNTVTAGTVLYRM